MEIGWDPLGIVAHFVLHWLRVDVPPFRELDPDALWSLLQRLSNAINNQETLTAFRAGLLRIRQDWSQRVVLDNCGTIRAIHPVEMKDQT